MTGQRTLHSFSLPGAFIALCAQLKHVWHWECCSKVFRIYSDCSRHLIQAVTRLLQYIVLLARAYLPMQINHNRTAYAAYNMYSNA